MPTLTIPSKNQALRRRLLLFILLGSTSAVIFFGITYVALRRMFREYYQFDGWLYVGIVWISLLIGMCMAMSRATTKFLNFAIRTVLISLVASYLGCVIGYLIAARSDVAEVGSIDLSLESLLFAAFMNPMHFALLFAALLSVVVGIATERVLHRRRGEP
jgi:ABC-type anion transport system duplicated permease subunit